MEARMLVLNDEDTVVMSFKIPRKLLKEIDSLCMELDLNHSQFVRAAIRNWICKERSRVGLEK